VGARPEPAVGWWVLVGEGGWCLVVVAAASTERGVLPSWAGLLRFRSSRRVVVVAAWLTRCLAINLVGAIEERSEARRKVAKAKPGERRCVCERTGWKSGLDDLTLSVFRRLVSSQL
jgi:hypothetical protein